MDKNKKFTDFIKSFETNENKSLVEAVISGFNTIMEAKERLPKHNFQVGDKVVVTLQGLQAHARSIPAHMGYSRETMSWREGLSKLRQDKTVGTVTRVFEDSDNLNVDFGGHTFGVYAYMVEKVS